MTLDHELIGHVQTLAELYEDETCEADRSLAEFEAKFRIEKAVTTAKALARLRAKYAEAEATMKVADQRIADLKKLYDESGDMRRIVCDLSAIQAPATEHVYILCEEGAEFLKIGFTSRGDESRRASVQTGNPRELRLVAAAPGARPLERSLHKRFAPEHHRGEWFRTSERLCAFVIELREEGMPPWMLEP